MSMDATLRKLVVEVMEKGYLLSLATTDEGGPWVADVIYVFDDNLNVYWMSDPDVRHSQALLKNHQVAAAITVSGPGEDNMGVQLSGNAEKIYGPRHDLAVKHFSKRNKPIPAPDMDVLEGDSWYVLTPAKIDLIHEKHFGFEKQTVTL